MHLIYITHTEPVKSRVPVQTNEIPKPFLDSPYLLPTMFKFKTYNEVKVTPRENLHMSLKDTQIDYYFVERERRADME